MAGLWSLGFLLSWVTCAGEVSRSLGRYLTGLVDGVGPDGDKGIDFRLPMLAALRRGLFAGCQEQARAEAAGGAGKSWRQVMRGVRAQVEAMRKRLCREMLGYRIERLLGLATARLLSPSQQRQLAQQPPEVVATIACRLRTRGRRIQGQQPLARMITEARRTLGLEIAEEKAPGQCQEDRIASMVGRVEKLLRQLTRAMGCAFELRVVVVTRGATDGKAADCTTEIIGEEAENPAASDPCRQRVGSRTRSAASVDEESKPEVPNIDIPVVGEDREDPSAAVAPCPTVALAEDRTDGGAAILFLDTTRCVLHRFPSLRRILLCPC